jgi:hypothetical protein
MAVPTQKTGRSNGIEARLLVPSLLVTSLYSHPAVFHQSGWQDHRTGTGMPLYLANLGTVSNPLY